MSRSALALGLAALWLLGRAYTGLTHDAALYAAQALRVLDPAAFARDLFFAYGAQDAYTLFPRLYAPLVAALGAGAAAMAVTIAGQAGFFAAAAAMVLRIAQGPARWWSLALLAVVSGYYGGLGVFRFAETFATARSIAEPLALGALALALAGRRGAAWAALAAAGALHLLVAAPAAGVLLLWQAWDRPRRLGLVAAAAVPAFIVVCAAGPRFDGPWREAVIERSPHLLLSLWQAPDWARVLWGLCVARLAAPCLAPEVRRMVAVAMVASVAGIAATGIGADLCDSALVAALQPWRAHWLAQFFAVVLLPVAVAGLWGAGDAGRAAAGCLAASCCFGRAELPAAAALALLALVFDEIGRRRRAWIGERALRVALLTAACAASVGLMFEIQSRWPALYGAVREVRWTDFLFAGTSVGGLLPVAALLWLAARSRWTGAGMAIAAGAFALSVFAWDARLPWPRFIERAAAAPSAFRDAVPVGAVVYWPMAHSPAWIALRRANWFGADQGAGIVFHRATAVEFATRKHVADDLDGAAAECRSGVAPACVLATEKAVALCARRDAPDFLVLEAALGGWPALAWPLPPEARPGTLRLFLYACADRPRK